MRSPRATHNLLAVSAGAQETGLNEFQTLDTSLLVANTDVLGVEARRENNANELTGKEEADTIYNLGQTVSGSFSFERAQPQHIALLLAFGLGSCVTAAQGSGQRHTITPLADDVDEARSLPSFTAAMRLGKTVAKRRFAGCLVDSVTLSMAEDSWVKVTGQIKGTGKVETTIIEETIEAAENATSLDLAANGVHGPTDAERLANVHRVRAELTPGVWTEVEYSAVSGDTPASITITAPGVGTDPINFKVLYAPVEPAWATLPARVVESPLRVSEMQITLGGSFDGTDFTGGRPLGADVQSVEYSLSNNLEVKFRPGSSGAYAGYVNRPARTQTLKLTRDLRDWMLQHYLDSGEYLAARIVLTGAEFATGENYRVELIFPRLGVIGAPISNSNGKLAEAGDLQVLQDDVHGSIIVIVDNQVAAYAA